MLLGLLSSSSLDLLSLSSLDLLKPFQLMAVLLLLACHLCLSGHQILGIGLQLTLELLQLLSSIFCSKLEWLELSQLLLMMCSCVGCLLLALFQSAIFGLKLNGLRQYSLLSLLQL